jgi:four helix bundle protein
MKEQILARTKAIALQVIKLLDELPNKPSAWTIAKQISKSATSIGANYRAVFRSKSDNDFLNKLKIVEEETDETLYWLELIKESGMLEAEIIDPIHKEVSEILFIVIASIKTTRNKINKKSQ